MGARERENRTNHIPYLETDKEVPTLFHLSSPVWMPMCTSILRLHKIFQLFQNRYHFQKTFFKKFRIILDL